MTIFKTLDYDKIIASTKKSDLMKMRIAEEAIILLLEVGFEKFNFDLLSKKSKVTRSLIYHYYPSIEELYFFISGFIRYKFQLYVIDKMKHKSSIKELLSAYIKANLDLPELNHREISVWLIYLAKCSLAFDLAQYNQSIVSMGTQRIIEILRVGQLNGEFKSDLLIESVARQIQLLITGYVVSRATESWSEQQRIQQAGWVHELSMLLICKS